MGNLLNIKLIIIYFKKYWFVSIIGLLVGLGVATFSDRYTKNTYTVKATVLRKPPQEKVDQAATLFGSSFEAKSFNLVNEVLLLKSFPLLISSVSKMDWNVTYFKKGRFVMSELYKNSPIVVTTLDSKEKSYPKGKLFECFIKDTVSYELYDKEELIGGYNFGDIVNIDKFNYKIDFVNGVNKKYIVGETYAFKLNDLFSFMRSYSSKLQVKPVVSQSTILEFTTSGENKEKELDFLNQVLDNLVAQDLQEKNYNAERTIEFIDSQLNQNTDSLRTIENRMQGFRNRSALLDLQTEGSTAYSKLQSLEEARARILLEMEYYDYLVETLNSNNTDSDQDMVVPSTIGVNNGILSSMISQLIDIQLEVNLYTQKERNSKNPIYLEKIQTIQELKLNILSHINNQKKTQDITLADIDKRIELYNNSLNKLPAAQRELANIQRKYSLNESIYMLLMQKKMEAGINKASRQSDYQIVNKAYVAGESGTTNNWLKYLLASIIGILGPLGIVYGLALLLDNRIYDKEYILNEDLDISIIADIPNADLKENIDFKNKSYVLEPFRRLRASLQYIPDLESRNLIAVTSSESGEGKSFCAELLSNVLAIQNKKVLYIDTDLRKSSMSDDDKKTNGLTEYLISQLELEDIIQPPKERDSKMYRISSGKIPPNPSELLSSIRFFELLKSVKKSFDFIIIDTAPLGIFSDAISIMNQADINLYIVREGVTNKKSINEIIRLKKNYNFSKLYLVYNGSSDTSKKYTQYDYENRKYKEKSNVVDNLLFD